MKQISYSATGLIVKNSEILLIKRASKPFKGYWALPGGHKENDETFEDCLKREALEETGLCVFNLKFFGGIRIKNRYGLQFSQFFMANVCSNDMKNQIEEVLELGFFMFGSLPSHIVPFHKKIIEDYLDSM